MSEPSAIDRIWTRKDAMYLTPLMVVTLLAIGGAVNVGGFWWTDESRHAMDGVYALDVMKDLPLSNLYEYTVQYFARYPALGLTWYPPFFAFIEGIVFAVIGISEISARLTVLLFALVGIIAWYAWVRSIWGREVAFFSALFFILNPIYILWSRSVMLEVPAVSMIIVSILSYHHYLKKPTHLKSLMVGLVVGAMLLTKQTTAFILPLLILYPVLAGEVRKIACKESLWAYIIIVAVLSLLAIHAIKFGNMGLSASFGGLHEGTGGASSLFSLERWALHAKVIVNAFSLPLLILSVVGAYALLLHRKYSEDNIIWLWIVFWYISFTVVSGLYNNSLRYSIYVAPAVALIASRLLSGYTVSRPIRRILTGVLFITALWGGVAVIYSQQPFVSGYHQVAQYVLSLPDKGTTLFCCKHDGNFTFSIRQGDDDRKEIVLRADKTLVSMAVNKYFGVKSYMKRKQDIYDILDKYGVGIVVVEDRDMVGLPEFRMLLEVVKSDKFELLHEQPVLTNVDEYKNINIQVYRYLDRKEVKNGEIIIPMPHIGRELRLPVN